ncbi:MAG: type IV toxin-antitoxin system AbiEi family antitoxin domain-containing protein [Lacisediminihabitans sp.]
MFTPNRALDVRTEIDRRGGIATRQQLIAAGLSGYDVTAAVRNGIVRRVRQARYATSRATAAALVAVRVGGMLAGLSAARSHGLWSGFDDRVHISVGSNASRLRTNVSPRYSNPSQPLTPDTTTDEVVLHWLRGSTTPELGPECWRVPIDQALRQVVRWSDQETAIACLDTARTVFGYETGDYTILFGDAPARDRIVASQSRSGSESGPESLVRQRLDALGIPYRQQVAVAGIGRVDFGLIGTTIVIEVDSRQFHDHDVAFERDRWRDGELGARGYTDLRLTYKRVTRDWPWCERMILGALAQHHLGRRVPNSGPSSPAMGAFKTPPSIT